MSQVIMPGESSEVFTVTGPGMSKEFLTQFRNENESVAGPKCARCGLALDVSDGETSCDIDGPLCIYGQMMEAGKC